MGIYNNVFFFAISRLASLNRQYVLRFFNLSGKLQTRTSQGFIKASLKIRLYIMLYVHPVPIGSMVLLYMVTWIPSIYPRIMLAYTENNGSVMGYWNHCNDWLLRFYFIETYYTWGMLVLLLSITVFLRKQPLSRIGWLHRVTVEMGNVDQWEVWVGKHIGNYGKSVINDINAGVNMF